MFEPVRNPADPKAAFIDALTFLAGTQPLADLSATFQKWVTTNDAALRADLARRVRRAATPKPVEDEWPADMAFRDGLEEAAVMVIDGVKPDPTGFDEAAAADMLVDALDGFAPALSYSLTAALDEWLDTHNKALREQIAQRIVKASRKRRWVQNPSLTDLAFMDGMKKAAEIVENDDDPGPLSYVGPYANLGRKQR